jgi:hypothetical protein
VKKSVYWRRTCSTLLAAFLDPQKLMLASMKNKTLGRKFLVAGKADLTYPF